MIFKRTFIPLLLSSIFLSLNLLPSSYNNNIVNEEVMAIAEEDNEIDPYENNKVIEDKVFTYNDLTEINVANLQENDVVAVVFTVDVGDGYVSSLLGGTSSSSPYGDVTSKDSAIRKDVIHYLRKTSAGFMLDSDKHHDHLTNSLGCSNNKSTGLGGFGVRLSNTQADIEYRFNYVDNHIKFEISEGVYRYLTLYNFNGGYTYSVDSKLDTTSCYYSFHFYAYPYSSDPIKNPCKIGENEFLFSRSPEFSDLKNAGSAYLLTFTQNNNNYLLFYDENTNMLSVKIIDDNYVFSYNEVLVVVNHHLVVPYLNIGLTRGDINEARMTITYKEVCFVDDNKHYTAQIYDKGNDNFGLSIAIDNNNNIDYFFADKTSAETLITSFTFFEVNYYLYAKEMCAPHYSIKTSLAFSYEKDGNGNYSNADFRLLVGCNNLSYKVNDPIIFSFTINGVSTHVNDTYQNHLYATSDSFIRYIVVDFGDLFSKPERAFVICKIRFVNLSFPFYDFERKRNDFISFNDEKTFTIYDLIKTYHDDTSLGVSEQVNDIYQHLTAYKNAQGGTN